MQAAGRNPGSEHYLLPGLDSSRISLRSIRATTTRSQSVARMQAAGRNPGSEHRHLPGLDSSRISLRSIRATTATPASGLQSRA